MEKELNINNSKKLIIGISVFFCTVILIIGATTAYFTQSETKTTGNIVSTDQVSIRYDDSNNDYMLKDLIPSSEEFAIRGYEIEENKCKDDNGYNICSVYRFTITNNADITQKLIVDMTPTLNTFHNLKFMLYEVDGNTKNKKGDTFSLTVNDKTTINLDNDLILNPNKSKTYELVYYILNLSDKDQTSLDAGKNFGAKISVNSLTTGTYISNQEGATCWKMEVLEDGTNNYKLTEFYGIDNNINNENYGNVVSGCEDYVKKDENGYYSIEIPSNYGKNNITILGNTLLDACEYYDYNIDDMILNNYSKIKSIKISEGIVSFEDGYDYFSDYDYYNDEKAYDGTFAFAGYDCIEGLNLTVELPITLSYIGSHAFRYTLLKKIKIPDNVSSIGEYAFDHCDLTYQTREEPLIIPSNVTFIGYAAFGRDATGDHSNPNLNYIKYTGIYKYEDNKIWYIPELDDQYVKELITTE